MIAFSFQRDLLIGLGIYAIALVAIVRWVTASQQDLVPRSSRSIVWIAIRLLSVVGVILLLCAATGIAIWLPITVSIIVGFVSMGYSELWGATMIVPVLIHQYVLGFPNKGDFILGPTGESENERHLSNFPRNIVGVKATTETPLRPFGTVSIEGQTHAARVDRSFHIEAGAEVTVVEIEANRLVVRASNAEGVR